MIPVILFLVGCGGPAEPAAVPPPTVGSAAVAAPEAPAPSVDVRALSFPAAWIAEQIGGEHVAVHNILPPGEDPPAWQPAPEVVAELADADLVVANGAGFEAWLKTASLPEHKLVKTADRLDLIEIQGVTHSHGAGGEHSHAGVDPHTFSDPMMMFEQALVFERALIRADPEHAAAYSANLAALERRLLQLEVRMAAALAPAREKPVAANHPAFNYLSRRYGFDLTSFAFDPQEPPSAADLEAFARWGVNLTAPVLLWEAAPTEAVKAAFPEGVVHVVVDPLEQPAGDAYDYIEQAKRNARTFERTFHRGSPE